MAPAPVQPAPAPVHHEPKKSSRKWLILLVIAGIAGAAAWVVQQRQEQAQQTAASVGVTRTAKVTAGKLDVNLRLAGQTSSRDFANITAPIMRGFESGRDMILVYLIPTGSKVKKGDLLAQIDAKSIEDHIDDIADDIERADADIRKRKAEQEVDMATLLQSIRVAQTDYEKAKLDARAAEVRTEVERELLKLAEQEAEARYKQVQGDVAQKKVTYAAELVILDITRQRHVRHRDRHKVDLVKYAMRAPMDGLAVSQQIFRSSEMATVQQGDQVYPGQLFMKVVNPQRMQVEANINQSESSVLRISQTAKVRLDAFPGITLPGHVFSINALATGGFRQQYYIRNIPVKVAIDQAHEKLIPDLSAAAEVLIQSSSDNAKQVPLGAVQDESGKPVVYVKKGSNFERRAVTVGLQNATHAEVTAGLEIGEEVALEKPALANPQTETRASL